MTAGWMMGIHACIWRRTIDLAGRSNGIKYGQRIAFERGHVNCTQPAIIQRNENSTGFVRNIETRTPQETILGVNTLFTYIDDVSSMETWPLARWLTCPLNFAFFLVTSAVSMPLKSTTTTLWHDKIPCHQIAETIHIKLERKCSLLVSDHSSKQGNHKQSVLYLNILTKEAHRKFLLSFIPYTVSLVLVTLFH